MPYTGKSGPAEAGRRGRFTPGDGFRYTRRPFREGEAVIAYDTWIHRLARIMVRPLARTPVTPNQLTTLRLITGLAAAGAYAMGDLPWTYWASAVFVFSILLDRADGELARLTGRTTEWGHTYDIIGDAICNLAVLVGIGVGLRHGALGLWSVWLGVIGGIAVAAIVWLVVRFESERGARSFHVSGFAGFDPDDAMLIVPLAMVLGGGVALIIAAAVAAPVCAAFFFLEARRRRREAGG